MFTHRRPEETRPAIADARAGAPEPPARCSASSPEETAKLDLSPAEGFELDAVRPRRRHLLRARRRRHDPGGAAPLTRAPACRCSGSTSARSASSRRSSAKQARDGLRAGLRRRLRRARRCPASRVTGRHGRRDRDQRRLDAPPARQSRRLPRLLGRARRGRAGPLRRPRGRHARRLDRLQPRQRRAGDGLGRGGLRGLVHRAAFADRARARGRPGRRADGPATARPRRPSTSRSTAGRSAALDAGGELEVRFVDAQGMLAQLAGVDLLPAAAGEVRAPRDLLVAASRCCADRRLGRAIRRCLLDGHRDPSGPVVDRPRAARAARREPAADGAGRAAARPGTEHPHRRDRRRQDAARARARPAARRQGARSGIVRDGAAEAYVEGVFSLPPGLPARAADERIPADAEELVLARRVWPDGRTRAYVCGRSATLADLRELGEPLLSFYGQHEHRKLMLAAAQLDALDAYCGAEQLALATAGRRSARAGRARSRPGSSELERAGGRARARARPARVRARARSRRSPRARTRSSS